MTVTYLVGDTREQTATIPTGSVSLVACSPPFIALRSYLPEDHPDKHREIGSEPDPATFIDTLLHLTAEWGRVLAPWGSIAVELGDTYAGSGGAGGDYSIGGLRDGQQPFTGSARTRALPPNRSHRLDSDGTVKHDTDHRLLEPKNQPQTVPVTGGAGWPRPKCLALVPQLYAASLAYGRNLLTGEPSPAGQWLIRNMIVWHRPNPAVGALGDKYRPSTSYITVATRSPRRWFDLSAVRGAPSPNTHARTAKGVESVERSAKSGAAERGNFGSMRELARTDGAPPLDAWFDDDGHDTWTVTTQPSSLAHYAMWPPKLAERLVLSMCPLEVCSACGEPRRRIERTTNAVGMGHRFDEAQRRANAQESNYWKQATGSTTADRETLGWTDCGHDAYQPGTVLDPFAGTGTTLAVAHLHGRDAIGIDIDRRNAELYPARLAECRRALFGTKPETPGQMDLFGAAV